MFTSFVWENKLHFVSQDKIYSVNDEPICVLYDKIKVDLSVFLEDFYVFKYEKETSDFELIAMRNKYSLKINTDLEEIKKKIFK